MGDTVNEMIANGADGFKAMRNDPDVILVRITGRPSKVNLSIDGGGEMLPRMA